MAQDGSTASPAIPLRVTTQSEAPPGWNAYVASHPDATAYHHAAAVNVGRAAFGLDTQCISAHAGDRIVGVLPLVEQSSLLFGRFLVSVPFFTYGGILADDEQASRALAGQLQQHAGARNVDH